MAFCRALFELNATNHLERYLESNEEVVRKLLGSTYANGIVTGADFEEAAFTVYIQAKDMFRSGGFNLRKFLTNISDLQQRINNAEGIDQARLDISKLSWSRTLSCPITTLNSTQCLKSATQS